MKKYRYGILEFGVHKIHGEVYSFTDEKGEITDFEESLGFIDCLNILGVKRWELRMLNHRNQYVL